MLLGIALLLVAGCAPSRDVAPTPTSPSPDSTSEISQGTTSPSSSVPTLTGFCRPDFAAERIADLVDAINDGNATAVAGLFAADGVHWDVYLTQPTGGMLRSQRQVHDFVQSLHRDGVHWRLESVQPPSGNANLPVAAVYGAAIAIEDDRGTRMSPMKTVIDCAQGDFVRAAGPDG